jgi:2'-5' RNA ligase
VSVTAVVCAAFDEAAEKQLLQLREVVRDCGARLPQRPRHRPHITLGAARVATPELVADIAASVAATCPAFEADLDRVGTFPRAGVLWLGCSSSKDLPELQRRVDAALRTAGHQRAFGERTAPANWVAHCTLATRLPRDVMKTSEVALRRGFVPVHARVEALVTIVVGGSGDAGRTALRG